MLCMLHRTDESQIEKKTACLRNLADFFQAPIHIGSLTSLIFMQYNNHSFIKLSTGTIHLITPECLS